MSLAVALLGLFVVGCCHGAEVPESTCIGAGGTVQCFPMKRGAAPVCQAGETQMQDCNRCFCANGVWACTLMFCGAKKEVKEEEKKENCISAGNTAMCFPVKREAAECTEGETKKVECNTCSCFGGQWACTLMMCLGKKEEVAKIETAPEKVEKKEPKCQDGKSYKIDCNWCVCNQGEWLCTLKACPGAKRSLAEVVERGVCQDNDVKRKDCNQCVCIGGEWMCTLRMCFAMGKRSVETLESLEARATCRASDVKQKECNQCLCIGGEFMCTLRMCHPIGKRDVAKMEVEKKGKKMDCFRGMSKTETCNRCICLGGNWACTLNYC